MTKKFSENKPHVALPYSGQRVAFDERTMWLSSLQPPPNWLKFDDNLVIIGANGAGKSRLGKVIEVTHKDKCHRISAQRALSLPAETQFTDLEKAELRLWYGNENKNKGMRWNQDMLNDFAFLLQVLLAEDFSVSTQFRRTQKDGLQRPVPETKLDKVIDIWNELLPHRHIDTEGNKVVISIPNNPPVTYQGEEASDGERVLLYLIGQTLAAPSNAILILGEPEIHIHKAILAKLWDELEKVRPDCLFVYLTHDLDFAASRANAKKIWLKSFSGHKWEWEELPEQDVLPDELYLKLLGSRKPVLFVEGKASSLDRVVHETAYSAFTISYYGSCEEVIRNTRAFRNKKEFHQIECFGLIDGDGRDDEEIVKLEGENVFLTGVAEVENLLVTEEVLRYIAQHLGRTGQELEDTIKRIRDKALDEFKKIQGQLVSREAQKNLENLLPSSIGKLQSKDDFDHFWSRLQNEVNPQKVYEDAENKVQGILDKGNYFEALKSFHHKGLIPQISSILGLTRVGFVQQIQNPNLHDSLVKSFQIYLPTLLSSINNINQNVNQKEQII